jgi:DNA-binding transcriptional regulator LsrR (DeoR family)
MARGHRARADQSAHRVNEAARLLKSGLKVSEATKRLSRQHGISNRQARRYVEKAQKVGTVEVPGPKLVFTVKLPEAIVQCLSRARSGPKGG